jgi:hypothetical protein
MPTSSVVVTSHVPFYFVGHPCPIDNWSDFWLVEWGRVLHLGNIIFSSPGPKVHMNYCHHLASVVCKLFTFQASSPKPLGQLEPSGGHLGFPIGIKNRNLVKDIPMIINLQFGFSQFISFREEDLWNFSQQASSPKPLGRLEPNLAGMFLGWSSTKFFVPVGYSIWLPGPIICSDWLRQNDDIYVVKLNVHVRL